MVGWLVGWLGCVVDGVDRFVLCIKAYARTRGGLHVDVAVVDEGVKVLDPLDVAHAVGRRRRARVRLGEVGGGGHDVGEVKEPVLLHLVHAEDLCVDVCGVGGCCCGVWDGVVDICNHDTHTPFKTIDQPHTPTHTHKYIHTLASERELEKVSLASLNRLSFTPSTVTSWSNLKLRGRTKPGTKTERTVSAPSMALKGGNCCICGGLYMCVRAHM